MKNLESSKTCLLLGLLVLLAVVTILPDALAQVTYTDADNPAGPLQMSGWVIGMGVAGALTGVGVWSAIRR